MTDIRNPNHDVSIIELLKALYAWKEARMNLESFEKRMHSVAFSGRGFNPKIVELHLDSLEKLESSCAMNLCKLSIMYAPHMKVALETLSAEMRGQGKGADPLGDRFELLDFETAVEKAEAETLAASQLNVTEPENAGPGLEFDEATHDVDDEEPLLSDDGPSIHPEYRPGYEHFGNFGSGRFRP